MLIKKGRDTAMTKITRTDIKNSVKDGATKFVKDMGAAAMTLGMVYGMFVVQPVLDGTMAAGKTVRDNARIWFE